MIRCRRKVRGAIIDRQLHRTVGVIVWGTITSVANHVNISTARYVKGVLQTIPLFCVDRHPHAYFQQYIEYIHLTHEL